MNYSQLAFTEKKNGRKVTKIETNLHPVITVDAFTPDLGQWKHALSHGESANFQSNDKTNKHKSSGLVPKSEKL